MNSIPHDHCNDNTSILPNTSLSVIENQFASRNANFEVLYLKKENRCLHANLYTLILWT